MENHINNKTIYSTNTKPIFSNGLRQYMLQVYNYMGMGLGLTATTAYFVASTPSFHYLIKSYFLFFALAPIGIVLYLSRAQKISTTKAQAWFWIYALINGISFSTIFLAYDWGSITRIFLITSSTFFAMSIYGYSTQKDITSWGSFLLMGIIGIIISTIVNLFLQSSTINIVTSIIGVGIFIALTAYDTQKIKNSYSEHFSKDEINKKSIFGALTLYLDFINLFITLMRLIGERR